MFTDAPYLVGTVVCVTESNKLSLLILPCYVGRVIRVVDNIELSLLTLLIWLVQ